MAQNSKIQWTHHTANLWWGCTKVHAGCDNCYAETLAKRWGENLWGNDNSRRAIKSVWNDLHKYQKKAKENNELNLVFVGSMMDIFEKPMPVVDSKGEFIFEPNSEQYITTNYLREKFFNEIVPDSPNLMFLLLTKRPSNINKYIPESWKANPPQNVMFGCSPVNQETADKLIPQLLEVNGKKFLSIEPQLDNIYLHKMYVDCKNCNGYGSIAIEENGEFMGGAPCPECIEPYQGRVSGIDWIIVGGESGHHKRSFNPDWARSIRDVCKSSKVPFFMKQIDKIQEIPLDLQIRQFPDFFTKI
jgi:protein gp37